MPVAEAQSGSGTYPRLFEAAGEARQKLKPFLEQRMESIRQFVGHNYGENGTPDKVPKNLIELYVQVYSRLLMPRSPRCLVTSHSRAQAAQASSLGLAINHTLDEIDFEPTAKKFVMNAMFGLGVMYVGYQTLEQKEMHGVWFDINSPFAEVVDEDDFVFDMAAKRWDQCQFIGHREFVPSDMLAERFPLAANYTSAGRSQTNEMGGERASSLSNSGGRDYEEFLETSEVWHIWLPFHGKVVHAVVPDGSALENAVLIGEEDWTGPEYGPYVTLGFTDVPGNLYPLSPVSSVLDLHRAANVLQNKVIRQGERRKNIGVVRTGSEDDKRRMGNAVDGDVVAIDKQTEFSEMMLGQVDQGAQALAIQLGSEFSYLAGNLDSLGGLSAQSGTATQDSLLAQAAGVRPAEMGSRVTYAMKRICRSIGYYLYMDPLAIVPITKTIEMDGLEPMKIETVFRGGQAEEEFYDLNFNIMVFSQQDDSPSSQLARRERLLQTVLPLLPMMQQQGVALDLTQLIKDLALYLGIADPGSLFSGQGFAPNQPQNPGPSAESPGKPPVTRRIVERVNRTAGTKRGQDHVMAMQALGKNVQPKQAASLSGGTK